MINEKAFELLFLGTCACDFSKRLDSDCKERFDLDARRSSALLINDSFLIDCGPHTLDALRIAGKRAEDITDLFITHTHEDHYNPENISRLAAAKITPLRIWVREDARLCEFKNATVSRMKLFENYSVTDELTLTAVPANHDQLFFPQHFVFDNKGKKLFYGCDGGWLLNASYNYLKGAHLAVAVLDCTTGDYPGDFRMGEHNSIPMIRLMLPSLKTVGAIDDTTAVLLSHLAPSLHKPHAETVQIARSFGADVAYDGMVLTV